MMTIVLKSIVTFLAFFGFVQLVKEIFNYIISEDDSNEYIVVIKVKNSENTLEAAVRTVILKSLRDSSGGYIPEILIVDMGSEDATPQIAQKLCDDYSFIHYTTEEQYNNAKEK